MSRANRIAPATLIALEPPRQSPSQAAALLGVADDEERRPIRSSGVQELRLAEDRTGGELGRSSERDERRIADRTREAVADVHEPAD
jgi:hypothetical protein